ncbi:MAG TPA: FAD-binding oxidoreductase [Solirubrobacteraceae bacterium]|nr:FAD-binding oxidoreductase [Solirubrobacteraceae bacterium]
MTLESTLAAVTGDDHVLTDPDLRAPYETDWTGRFGGPARCVVRPADAAQVASVLAACAAAGAAVVPQGGNTGLVGGGVPGPQGGPVVLSLRRLDALGPVDGAAGEVAAGAGVTLAALQRAARDAGWAFGVDLAARDTATVGGLVATDAGGLHGVRHGTMADQLLGLEAVLADGRRLAPGPRGGYDLTRLLAGSEGTLAVVTAARLRLVPRLDARATALVGCADPGAAMDVVARLRASLPDLEAVELLDAAALAVTGAPVPLRAPAGAALLVECAARRDPTDGLAGALDAAGEVVVAADAAQRAALWRLREGVPEAIAALGVPHKLDVGLPAAAIAPFLADLPGVLPTGARAIVFGHAAVGTLHVNVLGPAPADEDADDAVLDLVAAHGGSIAAEHGVGRAKARRLARTGDPDELAVMRAVREALDPRRLLNPGVAP